ncbi:MAG: SDR family oxidoreductase, partial [Myxococcota bacterium]
MRLADKNIVITGASSGIGLAAAKLFAREGARLLLVARGERQLVEAAETLDSKHVEMCVGDVSSDEDMERLAEIAREKLKTVHGVYLNAGTAPFVPLDSISLELFGSCMNTNVYSAFQITGKLLPLIPAGGVILVT